MPSVPTYYGKTVTVLNRSPLPATHAASALVGLGTKTWLLKGWTVGSGSRHPATLPTGAWNGLWQVSMASHNGHRLPDVMGQK
ncbi:MAG: hypothetical protein R3D51_17385 [Hyphomicrobiaceae bacterium]